MSELIRTIIQQWGKEGEIRLLVTLKERGKRAVRVLREGLASGEVEKALELAVEEGKALLASG